MLEALGSPAERSILSEKKRRTGARDGEEGKSASFLEEESQARRSSQEEAQREASESGEADKRSGREELEEEPEEEKKGQLTLSDSLRRSFLQ